MSINNLFFRTEVLRQVFAGLPRRGICDRSTRLFLTKQEKKNDKDDESDSCSDH